MTALKEGGVLHPILRRIWKDQTLDLQIRSNEVHIYYRGGRLLDIKPNGTNYYCDFDTDYVKNNEMQLPKFPHKVTTEQDAHTIVSAFPIMKQAIDFYFVNHKDRSEREFQQLIVRENNYSILSNATDYFIVDIEYEANIQKNDGLITKNARFDLLAIRWESDSYLRQERGLKKSLPKLAICELKYYTQALEGDSGLIGHVEDVEAFLSLKGNVKLLKEDALKMFQQKRELNLVAFGAGGNLNAVDDLDDSIELILMLANYDPECTKLNKALNKIQPVEGLDIKFAVANFLGYGLFKESIYSLADFKANFSKQIYCCPGDQK